MPTTCQLPSQPSQEWMASRNAYNGGKMDGFVSTPVSPATSQIDGGVSVLNLPEPAPGAAGGGMRPGCSP